MLVVCIYTAPFRGVWFFFRPTMGGVLDCSHGTSDEEVDVSTHVGPIDKPFHRMTIKELEYTVQHDKRSFERAQRERLAQRPDRGITSLRNVSTGAGKTKEACKKINDNGSVQPMSTISSVKERKRVGQRVAEV